MTDTGKKAAAAAAVALVEDGMSLGLGTGSTAAMFVDLLADRVAADGLKVRCVPTSQRTQTQAEGRGLTLTNLSETPWLDLTVDGADEISPRLALIKGAGGALLREKIVAAASEQVVIIADATKRVARLGAFPLPIEVARFGAEASKNLIDALLTDAYEARRPLRWREGPDGAPFVTDEGHLILDANLGEIEDPAELASALVAVPGVVETGLFVGLADQALIADADGVVTTLDYDAAGDA